MLDILTIIGQTNCPRTHNLKDFLSNQQVPFAYIDADEDKTMADTVLHLAGLSYTDLPVVVVPHTGKPADFMVNPTTVNLAEALGMNIRPASDTYDLVVVGAGPAGLAASVYAASEGVRTLLVDRNAPGGQAGTSSRIENFLGFPNGISGAELAKRSIAQARKFGVEILTPMGVQAIKPGLGAAANLVHLDCDIWVKARAVVLATGVSYRELPGKNSEKFIGAGIYYGASRTEALSLGGKTAVVVGGANSAGQGAVHFAKYADKVIILSRSPLAKSMSQYLIDQIAAIPNIEVREGDTVAEYVGSEGPNSSLQYIIVDTPKLYKDASYMTEDHRYSLWTQHVFAFIGAAPKTDWLPKGIELDEHGFIKTGADCQTPQRGKYETSLPGIYAAGDVRSGSVKRVATGAGEGSGLVSEVHTFLASINF